MLTEQCILQAKVFGPSVPDLALSSKKTNPIVF